MQYFLTGLLIAIWIYFPYVMIRTHYWFKFKGKILDDVGKKTTEDIEKIKKSGKVSTEQFYDGIFWRFNGYRIDLNDTQAIYTFWKPFKSFVEGANFLKEITHKDYDITVESKKETK